MPTNCSLPRRILLVLIYLAPSPLLSAAYRPGDIVPMSKMGQYHASRTVWQDVIGRHCPIFAVNREVLVPISKPMGYTGADPYKISFQVGREKFLIPWLLVINRQSPEVPMIDIHLRYSGSDLHGVTAKVIDMPHHYVETHPDIKKNFWDQEQWPKHILVRYTCANFLNFQINSSLLGHMDQCNQASSKPFFQSVMFDLAPSSVPFPFDGQRNEGKSLHLIRDFHSVVRVRSESCTIAGLVNPEFQAPLSLLKVLPIICVSAFACERYKWVSAAPFVCKMVVKKLTGLFPNTVNCGLIALLVLLEEQSEVDVASGFYVLFGSGLLLSFILAIYVLQSSQDKLARFVRETVAESSMAAGGVAKVE